VEWDFLDKLLLQRSHGTILPLVAKCSRKRNPLEKPATSISSLVTTVVGTFKKTKFLGFQKLRSLEFAQTAVWMSKYQISYCEEN